MQKQKLRDALCFVKRNALCVVDVLLLLFALYARTVKRIQTHHTRAFTPKTLTTHVQTRGRQRDYCVYFIYLEIKYIYVYNFKDD